MTLDIIITNYNYARYLGEAIHSAIEQTVPPNRVIVVDDGSTDNSRDVIASFGDSIIPVLQENAGQSAAFNSGFRRSDADLVLFLDSDDCLEQDAVQAILAAWRPGAAKLHFPLHVVDTNSMRTGAVVPSSPLSTGDIKALLIETAFYVSPPCSGNVYPRRVLEKVLPLKTDQRYCADTVPAYSAPFWGELIAIDRPLGSYRIHGANNFAGTSPDPKSLRKALLESEDRVQTVMHIALQQGFAIDESRFVEEIHYLKLRLSLLMVEPEAAENANASRLGLALRGVKSTAKDKNISLRKKGLFICWFLAVAVVPRNLGYKLVAIGGNPSVRSAALSRMIS
jgi:glycosyltransferase involved in cell wall biosynthesis